MLSTSIIRFWDDRNPRTELSSRGYKISIQRKNSASLVIGIMTDRNHVSVISYDFLRAKEVM